MQPIAPDGLPIESDTRFCTYCGTRFTKLPGMDYVVESTRDICPPAKVAIYAKKYSERLPDFENLQVLHYCESGVPKEYPPQNVSRIHAGEK